MDDDLVQNNAIHVDIDPDVQQLHVQPEPTRQALLNMLRNAIQASNPDAPVQVRVHSESEGMLIIQVTDTGSGMTAEQMQQAAHPFFSEFEPPGNGLGLTLVRLVAELHGGRLAILANDPNGSVCQIWIPRGAA